jgi:bifunctional non-homologous end joining protein LigD
VGLKKYHKKRDFTRTEEPKGRTVAKQRGSLFVVQKHAATRLHYDLRLELDGVLKSWAVPKGPSLDPAEKRLAVHVEDHPLEYGSFEGIIPQKEYGGGTVMLWDKGTWQCLGDPQKSYEKGKLKFRLQGEKLHGRWTLARMSGTQSDQGKNWLLIKGKDQFAISADSDILQDYPNSVTTGRTMSEITHKSKARVTPSSPAQKSMHLDPSRLNGAVKTFMPGQLEPQLATWVKNAPPGDEWLHEIKYDGYRILATIKNGDVKLYSRKGNDWTEKFPFVSKALQSFPAQNAIIDGEVVMLRQDGSMDFQALQNAIKGKKQANLYYYIFDLPYYNGFDLTSSPLLQRKTLLHHCFDQMDKAKDRIRFTDHITGSGEQVYEQACKMNLEGLISKRKDSPYTQKRSKSWVKVKCMKRQEFVIGEYTEPSGARTGFGALLLGYYAGNELIYSGRVGTGFSQKTIQEISSRLEKMEKNQPAYKDPPQGKAANGVHWVEPELVAEIEFLEWTRENHLRQPSFKGLRQDKSAKEITREEPKGELHQTTLERKIIKKQNTRHTNATVARVRISNPDKILFPDQGVSKLDLAHYYESIADNILPHIHHRPLTLLRCPEGRKKEYFYQKHRQDSFPEALHSIPIHEKETVKQYVMIKDRKGLISLVQLGVLEIHP